MQVEMKFIKKKKCNMLHNRFFFFNLTPKMIQYFNLHMKKFSIMKLQILCLNILHISLEQNKATFLVNCKYNNN